MGKEDPLGDEGLTEAHQPEGRFAKSSWKDYLMQNPGEFDRFHAFSKTQIGEFAHFTVCPGTCPRRFRNAPIRQFMPCVKVCVYLVAVSWERDLGLVKEESLRQ